MSRNSEVVSRNSEVVSRNSGGIKTVKRYDNIDVSEIGDLQRSLQAKGWHFVKIGNKWRSVMNILDGKLLTLLDSLASSELVTSFSKFSTVKKINDPPAQIGQDAVGTYVSSKSCLTPRNPFCLSDCSLLIKIPNNYQKSYFSDLAAGQIDGVEDGILEVIEPDLVDPKKFVPFRLININFRDATSDSIPALVDEHPEAMVYCLNEISFTVKYKKKLIPKGYTVFTGSTCSQGKTYAAIMV